MSRFRSFDDFILTFGGIDCSQAEASDGGQDVFCGLGPSEGSRVCVDRIDIAPNGLLKLLGRAMDAAPELFLGQEREKALDLVEPGGSGRREVDMPAGMPGQPALDGRGLVGGVVVHHQVDVEVVGNPGFESTQELEGLPAAVARKTLPDNLAGGDVQRREERGGGRLDTFSRASTVPDDDRCIHDTVASSCIRRAVRGTGHDVCIRSKRLGFYSLVATAHPCALSSGGH